MEAEKNLVVDAIRAAVAEAQQPKQVGDRLAAWFKALQTDPSSIDNPEVVAARVETLLEVVVPGREQ